MPFATLQAYVSCVHQAEDALNFVILQATTTTVEGATAGAMLLLVATAALAEATMATLDLVVRLTCCLHLLFSCDSRE